MVNNSAMKKDIDIAKAAGVSPGFISMLRKGMRRASIDTARRLEEASGDSFLYWMDPKTYARDGSLLSSPSFVRPASLSPTHDPLP
ncbi:helix-turn-helix transcriptional regulator [Desulfovibrio sp. OttesenSCG-928-A18]|nr:helix-turn-helix transcriptional regulator [Desulfovibrio sp. OttesenSCG-928-A18]